MCSSVALLFMFSLVHLAEPCSKRNENLTMAINAAIDLLSKAKSNIPDCSEEARMTGALDCSDIYERGFNTSGVYPIWPVNRLSKNLRLDVYCDMTEGGGWTVLNRKSPFGRMINAYHRDWASYKKGFGKPDVYSYYIGNDNIFMLTNQRQYVARGFQIYTQSKEYIFADCDFWIDDEFNNYTLHVSKCSGSLGGDMLKYNGVKFSTKDKDNDSVPDLNCAEYKKYGFWFNGCKPYIKTRDHALPVPYSGIKIRPSSYLKFERQVMS